MAGTIVVTTSDAGQGVSKYSIAWTSDASGNVSGNTVDLRRGHLIQAKFIPGGTTPTDLYDVTLLDSDSVDLLAGAGADRAAAAASIVVPTKPTFLEAQTVTPTVANAGNAKTGTIVLYVQ